MRRLVLGLYAVPILAIVFASAVPIEATTVWLFGVLACAIAVVITSSLVGFVSRKHRPLRPVFLGAGLCFATIFSVMVTHWPLRISYALSRSSIERLAAEVLAGRPLDRPRRVGLLTIEKTEVSQRGVVCLWTSINPAGNTGFVQCGPDHVPFNLWSSVSLDDRWQFIAED